MLSRDPAPASRTGRCSAGKRSWTPTIFIIGGMIAMSPMTNAESPEPTTKQTSMKPLGAAGDNAIRPFHYKASEEALADLRRRVAATQWPEKETVADASQGMQLATMQSLAHYWATDYDWRKCEARLDALPQFITKIDGLDIHFVH